VNSSVAAVALQITILTVSRDLPLQEERRLFLENAGYRVVSAHSDTEVFDAIGSTRAIDIMLVCHSVPEENRVVIVAAAKQARPGLPILMLYNGYDPTRAAVDGALHSVDDPETLVKMVGFLTAPRQHPPVKLAGTS
jgi:DNA-binding response OmpR family regulator